MKKVELLSPGGSLRKIKTAFLYGADAVYVGTPDMSLRSKSDISLEDIIEAKAICEKNNKKLYLTLNLYSHNKDIGKLPQFIETIKKINPDGVLVADPGIFSYLKEQIPEVKLHISTQANICSWLSVDYWKKQGAELCVLAREVSFDELKEIREKCQDIKLEAFVHGSMCMTYSGRCLLSNFMAERGANQGSCAHSCRWNYKVKAKLKDDKVADISITEENKDFFEFYLEEEFREGQLFEIEEDSMGSYILNSKDLCLMPKLNEYLEIGIDTFKIEGRNKGEYYAAITARAYRLAIDSWEKDKDAWDFRPFLQELETIANRGYTFGFHTGRLTNLAHSYDIAKTVSAYQFAGIVVAYEDNHLILEIKSLIKSGDALEFISPFFLEPIRLRMYEFIDYSYGLKKEKISPGRKGQKIKIPIELFHNEDINDLPSILPPLTVVRKEADDSRYDIFVRHHKNALKVEQDKASTSVLEIMKGDIKDQVNKLNAKEKSFKEIVNTCCSKGCNGCLAFWNDDKYEELRKKLKKKKLGEMLIKHIDF